MGKRRGRVGGGGGGGGEGEMNLNHFDAKAEPAGQIFCGNRL